MKSNEAHGACLERIIYTSETMTVACEMSSQIALSKSRQSVRAKLTVWHTNKMEFLVCVGICRVLFISIQIINVR